MKLSNLVGYLNLLNSDALTPDFHMAIRRFDEIRHVVENHSVQVDQHSHAFCQQIDNIKQEFVKANTSLEDLKHALSEQISQLESEQYQQSQALYEQEMCFETNEYILNRRLAIDPETKMQLTGRLLQYTDWRLPGMILRPGLEKFVEDLVPLDPLYLVDQHDELLLPALSNFTPEYRRRLRPYIINDYENSKDPLWQLPVNQFGLIFAYNYFNYKPIKVIKAYLHSIMDKLRPGGVAIFTFNDCDFQHGVALAEKNFMCYTPRKAILSLSNEIGFDTLSVNQGTGDVTWIEIQKPGDIDSIRGGQSLAKIIAHQ